MRRIVLELLVSATVGIFGCSGGGGGGASAPAPASGLGASPAQLQVSDSAQILITGISGSARAVVADPRIASTGPLLSSGSSATFAVTAIAGGATQVAVSDSAGHSISIPVSVPICLPPSPAFALLGEHLTKPAPSTPPPGGGATPVPNPYTVLYVVLPGSSQFAPFPYSYSVQLIGPGNLVVAGSTFQPASLALESTGYAPPAEPAGDSEFFSTADALSTSGSYRVQLVGQRCVPPQFIGSFSV